MNTESSIIYPPEVSPGLCYILAPSTCREGNLTERNLAVSDLGTSQ